MTLTIFLFLYADAIGDLLLPPAIAALKQDFVRGSNGALVVTVPEEHDDGEMHPLSTLNPSFSGTSTGANVPTPRPRQAYASAVPTTRVLVLVL